ncbi:hypothetical protein ElyMa_005694300 [Elysia marginata]|uniref:Uncharacterized protein n=1 Tax=Elysia marginata TaxID=1093978 RepID=A0AAV4FF27_9GAST|nr:hypothetical protein ElyMa_005694300 [Elysia marginata]
MLVTSRLDVRYGDPSVMLSLHRHHPHHHHHPPMSVRPWPGRGCVDSQCVDTPGELVARSQRLTFLQTGRQLSAATKGPGEETVPNFQSEDLVLTREEPKTNRIRIHPRPRTSPC